MGVATPPEVATDVDVAVVGAGPVGMVLAVLLAQRGRTVRLLERWSEPYRLPRAVHFDDEVGRILQACGIGDEVRAVSEPAEVYEWRNAAGTTLLRFGRIGAGPSGWPFSSMFCQPDLEAAIERRVDALDGVSIERGVEVTSIEQDDDRVTVVAADGSTVSARYVVGCDGANSTVRGELGIGSDDRGFFHDWLIVDVLLDDERTYDPVNLQICDPARPTTAVSGGPGRRRWEFMRLPDESLEDLHRVERAWELLEPWDVHPGNARLERHAVYTFQARVARSWQAGRVFLAGDAAHLMPPFAGQGMCSGLRDAANLAWKLDLVLGGAAPPDLLVTYEQERKPGAESAVDFSIELGRVICVPDPDDAAARDEAMSAAVTGEISEVPGLPGIVAGLLDPGAPGAGEQFVQPEVDGRPFDDVHGAGWRLVTDGAASSIEALDPALVEWFTGIGGAVVATGGPTARLTPWLDDHAVRWALQRPDFAVFGTAADDRDASALLDRLRSGIIDPTPRSTS